MASQDAVSEATAPAAQTLPQTSVLSEDDPAYKAATEAYAAYDNGDYRQAVQLARTAVDLAPDVDRYHDLLKNAEAALADALETIDPPRASALSEDDPAYKTATEAYTAYDNGDYRQAVQLARTAVDLAPDVARYHDLLKNAEAALALQNRPASAAPMASAADQSANAAYAAQRRGDSAQALLFAQQAVRLAPKDLSLRLLVIDLLNSRGHNAAALDASNAAVATLGESRALLQRRGVIQQALGDPVAAQKDFVHALELPGAAGTTQQLRLELAAAAMASDNPRTAYAALQPLGDLQNYNLWLARGQALAAMNDHTDATAAFDRAMALARTDRERAEVAVALIDTTAADGGRRAARAMLSRDRESGLLAPLSYTETAYLATRLDDRKLAYEAFTAAYAEGQLSGTQLIDAAYAAKGYARNGQAIDRLKQAIDEADAGVFTLDPQQRFNIRREISDLDRRWGGNVALTYGSSGISEDFLSPPVSSGEVLQFGAEVYWRPPFIGNRNGRNVDLFLRQFTTLSDSLGGPVGALNTQGAVGARVKPFSNVSFVLEVAKYFKIGSDSTDDFLLRTAISDGFNTDLMPVRQSWWTGQYYAEAGRYLQSDQNFASFDARLGRSYRMGGSDTNLFLTPFAGIAADYNDTYANDFALGAGPGLHLRHWLNGTKYNAPTWHVDLDVQYRVKLAGGDRANGWFVVINTTF